MLAPIRRALGVAFHSRLLVERPCEHRVQLAHRPFGWLNHRLIVGVDRLMEDDQEVVPRNDVLGTRYAAFAVAGPTVGGYLAIGPRDATNSTFDYVANATLGLGRSLKSVTSVGGQYYGRRTRGRAFVIIGSNIHQPRRESAAAAARLAFRPDDPAPHLDRFLPAEADCEGRIGRVEQMMALVEQDAGRSVGPSARRIDHHQGVVGDH